jgi:Mg2+/Co2+ transporter CorB
LLDISVGVLFGVLLFLILLSAFFSAAEIAMVSLNRHRLRFLAQSGHRGARLAQWLLRRPDRLIGVILLGSNFVNALLSALTTYLALQLLGRDETAIAVATVAITLVILIFTDLAPKTLATLHPERIALPSAYVLTPLLRVVYPLVWAINLAANGLLRLAGVSVQARPAERMSADELRTIVLEAGVLIPKSHQEMLVAILELEKIAVEDVMVPRVQIEGLDLEAEWDEIVTRLAASHYTRLPVYRGSLDRVVGMVHLRKVLHLLHGERFDRAALEQVLTEPYFIPKGTPLTTQLLNFKRSRRRTGLVVDEYGDLLGLVTLQDILEEIVGEFTTQALGVEQDIHPQRDGSYLISGTVSVRDLNRRLHWGLPTRGPKTLNGLIVEYLEEIPEPGTSLMLAGYQIEIVRTRGTAVQLARVTAPSAPAATEG